MSIFIFLVLALISLVSGGNPPLFPPEFGCKHDGIFLAWPSKGLTEFKKELPIFHSQLQIIQGLTENEIHVKLIVEDEIERDFARNELQTHGVDVSMVQFFPITHFDIWMRDYGPIFTLTEDEKKISIFGFNDYGYDMDEKSNKTKIDAKLGERVAKNMNLKIVSHHDPHLISEGGDRSVNRPGDTLLITTTVESQRNPHLSQHEMETAFTALMGVEKFIWLDKGVVEDDQTFRGRKFNGKEYVYNLFTTGGHNDEHARFVTEDTALISMVTLEEFESSNDLIVKENYIRMLENYEIVEKATNKNGEHFKIINFTSAELIYETLEPGEYLYEELSQLHFLDGSTFPYGNPIKVVLPCSYMNFLVTNGLVLYPQFYKEGMDPIIKRKDEEATEVLEAVFPDRKLIPIDIINVVWGGGGIHCITQQEPSENCLEERAKSSCKPEC